MSGAQHTAGGPEGLGEWRVEETPDRDHPGLVNARIVTDCEIVAEITGAVVCGDWGRHQLHTNRAYLIAAAPDLLEALQRLAVHMQNLIMVSDVPERFAGSFNEGQRQAEAAIAKATGEAGQ